MSCRTVVYKGMFLAFQLGEYYRDLHDPRFKSALSLVHQRFSTNTFPSWKLAHPYRMVAHNGEINTLRGNVNWMAARQASVYSPLFGDDIGKLWPISYEGQSDTACFDNALEFLVQGGYSLPHAMMMLIPEAWAGNPLMDEKRRAFYEYHAALMEPWDGPAAVAFTDGRMIGATLDRNGLRPARYFVTDDDKVIVASEMGVLPCPGREDRARNGGCSRARCCSSTWKRAASFPTRRSRRSWPSCHPFQDWLDAGQIRVSGLPRGGALRASLRTFRCSTASRPSATRRKAGSCIMQPDGRGRPGSDRLDGHRHAGLGAVEQAEAAAHLFQAEFRSGHQPADRPDPRGAGDEPRLLHRAAARTFST